MLLSKGCAYGLRAALYLATLDRAAFVSIREISNELGLSAAFLTKIFQKLTQAGLMQSVRGPSGGVAFARPIRHITLLDLVVAIDGPELFTSCVLGLPGCDDAQPCPLHEAWTAERARLHALFARATLAELAARTHREDLRLATPPSS